MHHLRAVAQTIGALVFYLIAGVLTVIGLTWPIVQYLPVPEPVRQFGEWITHLTIVWVLALVWISALLSFRTYKAFRALDDLALIRAEIDASAEHRAQTEERLRRSAQLQEEFETSTRADDKRMREIFYLEMGAKPILLHEVETARESLERIRAGEDLRQQVSNEFEFRQPLLDEQILAKRFGRIPPIDMAGGTDESYMPTTELTERYYAHRVEQYESWLHSIEAHKLALVGGMRDWLDA
jgi:hypothetical protein